MTKWRCIGNIGATAKVIMRDACVPRLVHVQVHLKNRNTLTS